MAGLKACLKFHHRVGAARRRCGLTTRGGPAGRRRPSTGSMPPSASTRSGGCWPRWCDTQRLRRAAQPLPPCTELAAHRCRCRTARHMCTTLPAPHGRCCHTASHVPTSGHCHFQKSAPGALGVAELLRVLGCVVQVAVVGDHRATARATDAAVRSSAHRPALFPRDKSPATLMTFPPPLPSRPNARSHSLSLLTPDTPAHGRPNHIRSWTR